MVLFRYIIAQNNIIPKHLHNHEINAKVKKDASTNTFDSYLLEKAKEEREIEEAEKAAKAKDL